MLESPLHHEQKQTTTRPDADVRVRYGSSDCDRTCRNTEGEEVCAVLSAQCSVAIVGGGHRAFPCGEGTAARVGMGNASVQ